MPALRTQNRHTTLHAQAQPKPWGGATQPGMQVVWVQHDTSIKTITSKPTTKPKDKLSPPASDKLPKHGTFRSQERLERESNLTNLQCIPQYIAKLQ
jgi:hypothetical protein